MKYTDKEEKVVQTGTPEEFTDLLMSKLKKAYEGGKKPDPNSIVQDEFYKEDEGARIRRGNTIKGDD